jgi:ubiquinone/menaquinone biosynthesis C-methylase UbiE
MLLNLVCKVKSFFSFLRLVSYFLFYPTSYIEYYELDSFFKRNTPYLIYSLINAKGGCLLDVGCGDGESFDLLPSSVFPIGVEISHTRTKRIRKHAQAILADAQNLPIRNGAIDFAVASEILEHLPNPSKCLYELYRTLKPKGVIGIVIPNDKVFTLYRLTNLKEFWKIIAYRHQQNFSHF